VITKTRRLPLASELSLFAILGTLWVFPLWAMPTRAGEVGALTPIDTSSPRDTLQGFLEFMNQGYGTGVGLVQSYLASPQLYIAPEDTTNIRRAFRYQEAAHRALDLSELPPATVHESARRLAIQLKEVLDRIDLPLIESIPDAQAMAKAEVKGWTLPNSEIRIRRVETGPRAGEYLFTAETVSRVPEFYDRVKELPYKPGASVGWHDFASYSPVGVALALRGIVPPRWLIDEPQYRVRTTFLDQPVWRWIGIVAVLGAGLAFVLLCFRLSRYWARRAPSAGPWAALLRPISLVIVTPAVALILGDVLRISGGVYQAVTLSLWTLFYLALTWTVWAAGGTVAANVIRLEGLRVGSIDSQLIRLVIRLATVMAAVAILIAGADRIGLPAYSVMAGLGVGGLAVALAAQQTLANLLGSLIIMFEKPFAIGHSIKVKDTEGVVERVGFRSTQIRTTYDSLVTIPSSQLVNSTIDNLELRKYRQVKTTLKLAHDTPPEKIEELVEGIRQLLEAHSAIRKDKLQVFLYEFGPHSLDVLVSFFLKVPNRLAELAERQRLFLAMLRLAEEKGVRLALPT
jgi:MscS family membrane protein